MVFVPHLTQNAIEFRLNLNNLERHLTLACLNPLKQKKIKQARHIVGDLLINFDKRGPFLPTFIILAVDLPNLQRIIQLKTLG